jgi:negative regulator of flagellin synthesis FlgM
LKIDRPRGALPNSEQGAAATQSNTESESAGAAKPTTTQGTISAKVRSMDTEAQENSSFDAEMVQNIRNAIAEGRFTVNAENVADGLLRSVSELIRSQHRSP